MNQTSLSDNSQHFVCTNLHPEALVERELAATAVNAVAVATGKPWQEIFTSLLQQAHALCLLPGEKKCVQGMLRANGFVLQPGTGKACYTAEMVRAYMSEHCGDGQVAVVKTPMYGRGGFVSAIIPDENGEYRIHATENRSRFEVEEIWIRWADGLDHSPVPRRSRQSPPKASKRKIPENHEGFRYHQLNPNGNLTGDCLVRGIAAACDITWHEAVDGLGKYGHTTINNNDVFRRFLKDHGFVQYFPAKIDGRRPKGVEFCRQMTKNYHNGERIFVCVGASHAAAALPFEAEDGAMAYHIVDTWDSSARGISEYWVKPKELKIPKPVEGKTYIVGERIRHPSFGEGVIRQIIGSGEKAVLDVHFSGVGAKKLYSVWVTEHCSCAA